MFFVSQLGKYLPGSVWPVLAQMEFGRRWGAPRRTMLAANVLLLAMVTATGLVVGCRAAAVVEQRRLREVLVDAAAALFPLLVALHPRTIPAVIDWTLARVGREPLGVRVTGRSMLVATLWGFATWVLMGLHRSWC